MEFITYVMATEENVELKYCESCGGLFLRKPATLTVYCPGCSQRLSTPPDFIGLAKSIRRRHRPARLIKGPKEAGQELFGKAHISSLRAVAMMEFEL